MVTCRHGHACAHAHVAFQFSERASEAAASEGSKIIFASEVATSLRSSPARWPPRKDPKILASDVGVSEGAKKSSPARWPRAPPKGAVEGYMTDYRDQINGILPKYAGHVPRGKDKYGASHFGK